MKLRSFQRNNVTFDCSVAGIIPRVLGVRSTVPICLFRWSGAELEKLIRRHLFIYQNDFWEEKSLTHDLGYSILERIFSIRRLHHPQKNFWLGGVDDEVTADVYFYLAQCFWVKIFQFQANLKWTTERSASFWIILQEKWPLLGFHKTGNHPTRVFADNKHESVVKHLSSQLSCAELSEFIPQCECICRKGW